MASADAKAKHAKDLMQQLLAKLHSLYPCTALQSLAPMLVADATIEEGVPPEPQSALDQQVAVAEAVASAAADDIAVLDDTPAGLSPPAKLKWKKSQQRQLQSLPSWLGLLGWTM